MTRSTTWSPELEQQAWDYINDGWREFDAIPSVVGLCRVLGRSRETLYGWARDPDSEKHKDKNFGDILRACNEAQELTLLNGSLSNQLNANIAKLVLGKHGYHDKQDTDVTSKGEAIKNEWHIHPTAVKDGKS